MLPVSGWDVAAMLAKAVTYAATLSAAGCVFFVAYNDGLLQNPERTRIRRLLGASLAAAAIASAATTLLLAASMGGDIASMFDSTFIGMLLRAGQGRATGIRFAGLICALFALSTTRRFQAPAIIGAILAATSFAWVGHIHALRPNTLPTFVLCLHLLGAAFWLGALAPLLIVTPRRERRADRSDCGAVWDSGARRGGSTHCRGRHAAVALDRRRGKILEQRLRLDAGGKIGHCRRSLEHCRAE